MLSPTPPRSRTPAPAPSRSLRSRVHAAAWALALVPLLFASCVSLVASYDAVTDRTLQELAVRTETALARGDAGQLSAEESTRVLREGQGTVRALESRVALYSKNQDEIAALRELGATYKTLADRGRPLRSSVAGGLRARLLDVQQIQFAKKRSARFTAGLRRDSAAP